MSNIKVHHKTLGVGYISEIREDYVSVKFENGDCKDFKLASFNLFFSFDDPELKSKIDEQNQKEVSLERPKLIPSLEKNIVINTRDKQNNRSGIFRSNIADMLLGPRSETIYVKSENQMFELVGYMAVPGRIKSIEAEIPKDGRDEIFEQYFPDQVYRPIELGYTPSGMPNKLAPQFRINFLNIENCPEPLKSNMRAGNTSCVARINKSRFVLNLVEEYGFRFGENQDQNAIKENACVKGYLVDYNRGYEL